MHSLIPAGQFLNSGNGGSSDYSSDIVGRRLSGTEPLHVAAVAEQMSVKRETAATFLVTQLHAAVLRKRATSSLQPRLPCTLRASWESAAQHHTSSVWKNGGKAGRVEGGSESLSSGHQGSLQLKK